MSQPSSSDSARKKTKRTLKQYTMKERVDHLRQYHKYYSSPPDFSRDHNVPRGTLRDWLRNEKKLLHPDTPFQPSRIRMRESERPELDKLLFQWYRESKRNSQQLLLSRYSLLYHAKHLSDLLTLQARLLDSADETRDAIGEVVTPDDASSDETASDDYFVETDPRRASTIAGSIISTSISSPPKEHSSFPALPNGIVNPSSRCYLNSVLQILYRVPGF